MPAILFVSMLKEFEYIVHHRTQALRDIVTIVVSSKFAQELSKLSSCTLTSAAVMVMGKVSLIMSVQIR